MEEPALGAQGVPDGWRPQNWRGGNYDFTIADNQGHRVLHLKSAGDGSTIIKDIKGKVHLKDTPILEWSWRIVALPKNADSRHGATDDQAGQVYVVWPRFPTAVRSRIIGYVWDTTAPPGTIVQSEKTSTVTYIVLRSGPSGVGKWIAERRNVFDDFQKIYGEVPDDPGAVAVAIDSNDAQSTAEAFVGPLVFRGP